MTDVIELEDHGQALPGGPSTLVRRRRRVIVLCIFAVVLSTIGVAAATRIKSPAQVAADTQPPTPSLLTAPVVEQVLSTSVVLRGKVTSGRSIGFTPVSVAGTSHGPGGSAMVVTRIRSRGGATVDSGDVVLDVSERPVIVFHGAFPAYRDMIPGEQGGDIEELQHALAQAGFRTGDRKGCFGTGTQRAVRRFYQSRHYAVPLTDNTFQKPTPGKAASAAAAKPSPTTSAGGKDEAKTPVADAPATSPVPMVPMSEVAFLPHLPARVASIGAAVGEPVGQHDGALISFTTGDLALTGQLNPADAPLVRQGALAEIVSEETGYSGRGEVVSIGRETTSSSAGDPSTTFVPLNISPVAAWPSDLVDQDVRITITTAATKGKVLAVPEAAITAGANGATSVTVVGPSRTPRVVPVTVGASADGLVEIQAKDESVRAGTEVVTGR